MHAPRALTGNVVYNWFHQPCSYRVHMDLLGDRARRSAFPAASRFFLERGRRHERRIFEDLRREHGDAVVEVAADPTLEREADFERRAEATIAAMAAGARFILHGFLIAPEHLRSLPAGASPASSLGARMPAVDDAATSPPGKTESGGIVCRGETDLLVRIDDGASRFGAFHYAVGDVKSSQHARFSQKMQVTFYSWILGALQDRVPSHGFIVTGEGRRERFETDETIWTLRHFLEEEVHEFLEVERTFHQVEPSCSSCHWREHCRDRAAAEDDIALVPGLRRIDKRALRAAGVHTRKQLVACGETELRALGRAWGNRLDGFRDLKKRASAQQFGTPILRQHPRESSGARRHGGRAGAMAAPDLFSHRGPLLLIASAPDHYDGSEAMVATEMLRVGPEGFEAGTLARAYEAQPRDAGPLHLLADLIGRMHEIESLLRSRRERALPVFLDGRTRWRIRRAAEASGQPQAIAAAERLVSESIGLADVVDRTWYLPFEPRDVQEIGEVLARKVGRAAPERGAAPDVAAVEAFLVAARGLAADVARAAATSACDARATLFADHDLDAQELAADPHGLRTVLVRAWRSGDEALEPLLAFDLDRELACGRFVMEALWRTAAAPAEAATRP